MKHFVTMLFLAVLMSLESVQAKEAVVSFSTVEGRWAGTKLLWLDPTKPVAKSDAKLVVTNDRLEYDWEHEGKPQKGSLTITSHGVVFQDSFHQAEAKKSELGERESRTCLWRVHPRPTTIAELDLAGDRERASKRATCGADGQRYALGRGTACG